MAFFKFRLPNPANSEDGSTGGTSGESLEALRRRARQRLIGATVLVLLAVIGFPILFDTQPRPVAVDIPIDIPDKQKTSPQTAPVAGKPVNESAKAAAGAEPVSTQASLGKHEEVIPTAPVAAPTSSVASASVAPAAKPEAEAKPAAADKTASDKAGADKDKSTAAAKPTDPAAPRLVVQVGAYADDAKARDVRHKLEKAGIKTYTHVAETKEGKRTRVRIGPFASKEEAEKVVARLKTMNLSATILTL
jgi:DedD protein